MKQRLLSLLLLLVLAIALAVPAAADVIWEPDDAFYNRHRDQCTYEHRVYELAGYGDSVQLWSAPDGRVREELPNGTRGTVQFRWSGSGVEWGYIYGLSGDWEKGGWIPMGDLTLVYDSQEFIADHADEIVTGDPVPVEFHSAMLYSYPGGPAAYVLNEDARYMPFSDVFSTVYTDEDGLLWGHIGYYMGTRDYWVCLDDPMSEGLSAHIVESAPSAAQLRGAPTVEPGAGQALPLILAAVLVVVVVAVTVFLLHKLRPRKKQG